MTKPITVALTAGPVAGPPALNAIIGSPVADSKGAGHCDVMKPLAAHGVESAFMATSATTKVSFPSDWLQVVGVDAGPIPAQMIEVDLPRDELPEKHVDAAMSQPGPIDRSSQLAIPLVVDVAGPYPAAGRADRIRGEWINEGRRRASRAFHAIVVLIAHSAPKACHMLRAFGIAYRAPGFHEPTVTGREVIRHG